jgi:hypothetical protein
VRVLSSAEVYLTLLDSGAGSTLQVGVVRGLVDVETDAGRVSVQAGEQVMVREGEAPTYPAPFNSARMDGFVRWSQALTDSRRGAASATYLPADVRMYGSTFDQYGSWSYAAPYGYVWYPRVAASWRPYHHGKWRWGAGFGWTFVGYDPWGWATHHYGRWGLSAAGGWFWIPKAGWGPAWVSWAVAPGYVGWCPLGYNNRPVRGFWKHPTPYRGPYYGEPWRAWSVVHARSFRHGSPVHHNVIDPGTFAGARAPAFIQQPTPPSVAIPRGSVVAPGSRVAGPSVAPRGNQSRRGPALADASAVTGQPPSRRGFASSTSAVPAPRGDQSRRSLALADAGVGQPASRRGFASSTPSAAPPAVIYHRGTPIDPAAQTRGNPYERAGVAVPRGLPAHPDRGDATPASRVPGPSSPYAGAASPYSRGRSDGNAPDASTSAVPRSGRRETPYQPGPRSRDQRSGNRGDAPAAAPRGPSEAGPPRGGYAVPRATPQSAPASRGDAGASTPRSAPSAGAPSGGRSSSGSGSSTGTAVPRRR